MSPSDRSGTMRRMSSAPWWTMRNPPPVNAELPPRRSSGARSSSSTRAPLSRADSAAHSAALPPPITITSNASPGIERVSTGMGQKITLARLARICILVHTQGLGAARTRGGAGTPAIAGAALREEPEMSEQSRRLRSLMARQDRVLAVMHPPSASHARLMERAGCEAGFVGTGGVVGACTGLADVGVLGMMECVQVAGWIARAVSFPVIMDGDTGHGGIMAVRRMIRECVRAGIAGVRIDDQPIEGKRRTQSSGVTVVPLEQAIARYRAAVDMRNEIDPN